MDIKFGDLVRINKPGDYNHERVGMVKAPFRLARQIPEDHMWVEFVSDHPEGGLYSSHYALTEMEKVGRKPLLGHVKPGSGFISGWRTSRDDDQVIDNSETGPDEVTEESHCYSCGQYLSECVCHD